MLLAGPFYFKYLPAYHDPPPLGLLSLAAVLLEAGYQVEIPDLDTPLRIAEDYQALALELLSREPGLVGLSGWAFSYHNSIRIAQHLKALRPDLPIIFGGPHASVVAEETLRCFPCVDAIVVGEGEPVITAVVEALTAGRDLRAIPGLCFRDKDGRVVSTPGRNMVADLDTLPIPAYRLFRPRNVVPLETGRGCPFQCYFCSTSLFFARRHRLKSPGRIVAEIKELNSAYGLQSFAFTHDTFTLDRDRVFAFCGALRRENLDISWSCSTRPDQVDEETLRALASSGCQAVFFGVESGSRRMQRIIRKNLDLDAVVTAADQCLQYGITPTCSFIIGFPEETEDDLRDTLSLYMKLLEAGAEVQITVLSPAPDTELYAKYEAEMDYDGNFSGFSDHLIGREDQELIKEHRKLFPTFHFVRTPHVPRARILALSELADVVACFTRTIHAMRSTMPEAPRLDPLSLAREWEEGSAKETGEANRSFYPFVVAKLQEMLTRAGAGGAVADLLRFDTLMYSLETLGNMERLCLHHPQGLGEPRAQEWPDVYPALRGHAGLIQSRYDLRLLTRKISSIGEFLAGAPGSPRYYAVAVPAHRHWTVSMLTEMEAAFLALCDGRTSLEDIAGVLETASGTRRRAMSEGKWAGC